jgi:hypothetical protein
MSHLHVRRFVAEGQDAASTLTFDRLTDLWAFGDRHAMPLIQNASADAFARKVRTTRKLPDGFSVAHLWERTRPGSALRALFVEMLRAMWTPDRHRDPIWEELLRGQDGVGAGHLACLVDELAESRHGVGLRDSVLRRVVACEFHVHEEGEVCQGAEDMVLGRGERAEAEDKDLERGGRGPHRGRFLDLFCWHRFGLTGV